MLMPLIGSARCARDLEDEFYARGALRKTVCRVYASPSGKAARAMRAVSSGIGPTGSGCRDIGSSSPRLWGAGADYVHRERPTRHGPNWAPVSRVPVTPIP